MHAINDVVPAELRLSSTPLSTMHQPFRRHAGRNLAAIQLEVNGDLCAVDPEDLLDDLDTSKNKVRSRSWLQRTPPLFRVGTLFPGVV